MKFSMTEREIERYLVKRAKEEGGVAYKFVSPGRTGVPDRLVVMPYGRLAFVEVKKPSGVVSERQKSEINFLQTRLHMVRVVYNKKHVDQLMEELVHG